MSTNKNATIRYQVLDRCFRNPGRKYFIEDLMDECNEALSDLDILSTGVKRRQIYDDIKFMRDSRGFDAPLKSIKDGKRVFYRYEDINFSINNQPLNEQEAQQLKESLLTLSRFKGMPQFDWMDELFIRLEQSFNLKSEEKILSFEENVFLKGREFIGELYDAIVNKQVLKIEYHPFKREKIITFEIHPYHIKQYNNRWFLFGISSFDKQVTNVSLDRIVSISNSRTKYITNKDIDFNEYFEDVIGVSVSHLEETINVLLRIDMELWPYIKTKPLHGSQKVKERCKEYVIIKLELKLNYELESLILSHGEKIVVQSPQELKKRINRRLNMAREKYLQPVQNECTDEL